MAQVVLENVYKSFLHRGKPHVQQGSAASVVNLADPVDQALMQSPPEVTPTAPIAVLRRINLTVQDGEFLVLVGPSGCGKSTLLRLIAGLELLTAGNIWVGDRLVNDLPPKQRDIAMVFQSYALYPHLNVYDNLAFGLRRMPVGREARGSSVSGAKHGQEGSTRGLERLREPLARLAVAATRPLPKGLWYWSAQERQVDERVRTVAKMLQIDPLLNRLPRQLSGGQKQRVALGRAMARNPQVFLMDEPLSNLDAKLRTETRAQIVSLQRQLGITTIYVTHDQTEAMTMGDRIAVMNAGQIQQVATPLDLYHHPANRFVAEFIGSPAMNFLPVMVKAPLLITHPAFRMTLPDLWESALHRYDGRQLILGIRPEHLNLGVPAPKNLPGRVRRVEALGSDTYLTVDVEGVTLQARVEPSQSVRLGEEIWLALSPEQIHLFDPQTELAIAPD